MTIRHRDPQKPPITRPPVRPGNQIRVKKVRV